MTRRRRLCLTVIGCALFAPILSIDESGNQLGLGLYLAFIGMPLGMLLIGIGIFNYTEPPGMHLEWDD